MAPNTRTRRQRAIPKPQPSVETTTNNAPLLSSTNNHEASNSDHEPEMVFSLIHGARMLIPRTYDPDTYDPDARMPWTPEPEPSDPETYAAWGRKHFGDEWYELRKTMLQERDIYLEHGDPVYKHRQIDLRIIEHKIERRPFEPEAKVLDKGWKRLWARLSKDLSIETSSNPASPKRRNYNDTDTDLSGYDTYDPTPSPRERTPPPDDPWERVEYDRKRMRWDEERYQFEKFFLREALIDGARSRHENEPGDREAREKREEMESFRYSNRARFDLERQYRQDRIDLLKKGWTQEQIDAEYRADVAFLDWRQKNPEPRGSGDFGKAATPDERAASDSWAQKRDAAKIRFYGELPPEGSGPFGFSATQEDSDTMEIWSKGIHARVARQQQAEALPGAIGDASSTEEASNPRISSPRQKNVLHQTRGGRITTNAPTHAEASPPDRRCRPSGLDMLEELGDSTRTAPQRRSRQRKTYKKERASRRLAGKLPEYGMLLGQGEAEPLYKASSRQPSNTRQASGSSHRSGKLSKKPAAVRSVKPAVLKSGQARTGRPKRLAKGSKGMNTSAKQGIGGADGINALPL